MSVPEELVQAAVKEYAMYTDERMTKRQVDGITHALAAAFAALPKCEEPAIYGHRMPSGNFHRFHDKTTLHMDGCVPLYDLLALAREFGEPPTPDGEHRGDNWPCTDHSTHPPGPCKPPVPKDHRPWG